VSEQVETQAPEVVAPVVAPAAPVNNYWHDRGFLQISHQTKPERFPKIFDSAKQLKPDAKRILSFGCSTGEECQSLASRFPHAQIVGVEIDYHTMSTARRNNKHPDRVFFHDTLGATGSYDLVTSLMVLFSMEPPLQFEKWHQIVSMVDKHVNPGGIWMIYTSEFPLKEADCYKGYDPIREWTRIHDRNKKEYYCGYYRKKNAATDVIERVILSEEDEFDMFAA
jgi:2-polyprenyl-3-methyl-5-hydroxy-6-metoxy-1,4-benzoquinol methylase